MSDLAKFHIAQMRADLAAKPRCPHHVDRTRVTCTDCDKADRKPDQTEPEAARR